MNKLAHSTAILGLAIGLTSSVFADEFSDMDPVTLRLAHVVNEQDGFHTAAVKFQELVRERTEGAVTLSKIKLSVERQSSDCLSRIQ